MEDKVMELQLLRTRNIEAVIFIKRYAYGDFEMRVDINPDGTYVINAKDKWEEFEIMALPGGETSLSIKAIGITTKRAEKFTELIEQALELVKIIDNDRENIIKIETVEKPIYL